jgi:hypothetical protein
MGKQNGAGMPINILGIRNSSVTINITFLHVPQMDETMLPVLTRILKYH